MNRACKTCHRQFFGPLGYTLVGQFQNPQYCSRRCAERARAEANKLRMVKRACLVCKEEFLARFKEGYFREWCCSERCQAFFQGRLTCCVCGAKWVGPTRGPMKPETACCSQACKKVRARNYHYQHQYGKFKGVAAKLYELKKLLREDK